MSSAPPPLPPTPLPLDPPWKAYVRSVVMLLPGMTLLVFGVLVLQPKLQKIWEAAGLEGMEPVQSRVMGTMYFLSYNLVFLIPAVSLLFMVLELYIKGWPRYRRRTLFMITFLINTALLFWLATLATGAFLAVPKVLADQ